MKDRWNGYTDYQAFEDEFATWLGSFFKSLPFLGPTINYIYVGTTIYRTGKKFLTLGRQLIKLSRMLRVAIKREERGAENRGEILRITFKLSRVINELLEILEDLKQYASFTRDVGYVIKNTKNDSAIRSMYKKTQNLQKKYGIKEYKTVKKPKGKKPLPRDKKFLNP